MASTGTSAAAARSTMRAIWATESSTVIFRLRPLWVALTLSTTSSSVRSWGVARFDASVGGLGGCPFAPGATGNVPTEDVVHLLNSLGMATGVDLDRLIEVALHLEGVIGRTLPGQVMRSGPWYRLPRG